MDSNQVPVTRKRSRDEDARSGSGKVASTESARMHVDRLRAARRRMLFGSVAVLVGVVAGSPWWFGWFGGPSSNVFVTGPVPAAKGVFRPDALDEQRAAAVAKILGPDYQIVSVSKFFVYNKPEVPGPPISTLPGNGASAYGSGTDVILDSTTARIDVGLAPIEPPAATGLDHVVPAPGCPLWSTDCGSTTSLATWRYQPIRLSLQSPGNDAVRRADWVTDAERDARECSSRSHVG